MTDRQTDNGYINHNLAKWLYDEDLLFITLKKEPAQNPAKSIGHLSNSAEDRNVI